MTRSLSLSHLPAELWRWDAVDLAQAIRLRTISSREAVEACLARLHDVNPKLNAVVEILAEEALTSADAADAKLKRGEVLGALHGVPLTTKQNVDQQGLATVNGVAAFRELIASEDSPSVANLKRAGAVIIGRSNTPAFSMRYDTDNDVHGRTFNPWSHERTPGGSSGGSAAAVAAGIGPIAHGNDYGGSIRYPAYCCGVAGIRPTFGRVPSFNATAKAERPPTAQMMSVQGPLARRVRDLRIALAAMAQADTRDPWWVPAPLEGPAPQRPVRVALVTDTQGWYASSEVLHAVREAGAALQAAGYAVEEAVPPAIEAAVALWHRIVMSDVRTTQWDTIKRLGDARVVRATERWMQSVPQLSLEEYTQALADRAKHVRDWLCFMERYPLVLGPNSGEVPLPIGFDLGGEHGRRLTAAQSLMTIVNLLGFPAVAVPVGLVAAADAPRGLPLGVQIIASRFREDLALEAAEVVEAAHGIATPIDPVW